jgi:hypothetical protein
LPEGIYSLSSFAIDGTQNICKDTQIECHVIWMRRNASERSEVEKTEASVSIFLSHSFRLELNKGKLFGCFRPLNNTEEKRKPFEN